MTVRALRAAAWVTIVTASLSAGTLAFVGEPASAAVTCPTVSGTGTVTPPPAAGDDWSGCNLTGANFFGMPMSGLNLSDANLTNAILIYDSVGSNLTDANLSGANMTGVNLTGATVTGAKMATASITNIRTFNTVGVPASLPPGWADVNDYIVGPTADLSYALLNGQDLAGLDLDQAGLAGADLAGANLTGTDLANAGLTGVQSGGIIGTPSLPAGWQADKGYLVGSGANLNGATLTGVNLAGVNLSSTDFEAANLSGADLSGANLGTANLYQAVLSKANLSSADLDANLTSANLTKANLTSASAANANLSSANLTDATLTGASLADANVADANLAGTDLSQVTLTGVQSGGITGSPKLPANWALFHGYLAGPSANLTGASLQGLSLTSAVLDDANLSQADLTGASLPSANLENANLSSANLTSATLTSADLTNATLTSANLTGANLDNATTTGATLTGVTWYNTICPDGSNSNAHDSGCFSALDLTPPVAHPGLLSGGSEVNGWFNAPVTVDWNWTDAGSLNPAKCTMSSTTTGNGPLTLTASCTDLAGNEAQASYQLNVDTTRPVVMVTGVAAGRQYVLGRVPAAGCTTKETVSGIAQPATLSVSTGGSGGVGPFTATCAGAVSVAGVAQAGPVQARYTVGYGFGGFTAPKAGATVARSAHKVTARFRLLGAGGKPISAATAKALAWAQGVRVMLRGPGIRPVSAFCTWSTSARSFSCALKIPGKVRTGKKNRYTITAEENVGTGFYPVPATGTQANPVSLYFK
ncbi:MAG: pentapeptide repeat-containing protein [Streptosporangiaceae bacterium]